MTTENEEKLKQVETPINPETLAKEPAETPAIEPTRMEEFSKTGTAAKLSGSYHKKSGFIKRKIGEWTDDSALKEAGLNEELLGNVHHLVGVVRKAKEDAVEKVNKTKLEAQAICRKHGGRLIVVAADFIEDMKKTLFK